MKKNSILYNGHKGVISILLCIVLLPFWSIGAYLVESGRYHNAVTLLEELEGNSAGSVLSNRDKYLHQRFGLLAISQDQDVGSLFKTYFDQNENLVSNSFDVKSVTATGEYSLSDPKVMFQQILEYSKYTVPARMAKDTINLDEIIKSLEQLIGIKDTLESANKIAKPMATGVELIAAIDDLIASRQAIEASKNSYNLAYTNFEAAVKNAVDNPPDTDEAKASLKSAIESALTAYVAAIDDLRSKIKALSASIHQYISKYESLLNDIIDSEKGTASTGAMFVDQAALAGVQKLIDFGAELIEIYESYAKERLSNSDSGLESLKTTVNAYNVELAFADSPSYIDPAVYRSVDPNFSELFLAIDGMDSDRNGESNVSIIDFLKALVKVLDTLFQVQGIVDPRLNSQLSAETTAGFPSNKDRSGDFALRIENSADAKYSERIKEDIEVTNGGGKDFTGGGGNAVQENAFQAVLNDIANIQKAVNDMKEGGLFSLKFWKGLLDIFVNIGKLVADLVVFIGGIIANIVKLIAEGVYEHILFTGYLGYNLSNRTTVDKGSTLTGYKFSADSLSAVDRSYGVAGTLTGMMDMLRSLADGGTDISFKGAELEYVLWGKSNEYVNQALTFGVLWLFRVLLNIPSVAFNQEAMDIVVACNIASWLAFIIYIVVEGIIDTFLLVNYQKVGFFKFDIWLTPSGLWGLLDKMEKIIGMDISGGLEKDAMADLSTAINDVGDKWDIKFASIEKPKLTKPTKYLQGLD